MRYLKNGTLKSLMIATFISLGLASCSDDDSSEATTGGTANMTVRMTDAPGDYDEVNIDVQDVQIKVEADAETEADIDSDGWVSLDEVETGVYDLLELTGGISQILADSEVPAGYVSQMRLVLGTENTVVVNGESKPLNTPSAQQSGLKLQLNQELEEGENYAFLLDFDVEESIVAQGNGGFSLKPVIRLSADADAGIVIGKAVIPAAIETNVQTLVKLSNSSATISAYTDAEGNFALNGVPAGTYDLEIIPEVSSGLTVFAVSDIEVKPNETKDLGELEL
ncbi:DUF4382 domain-containing protein [Christiangramia forsetii]|uniref:DUF4382 domain-containing protein n=2 Tax=Christiangramia forsetii TaxID=411153 RepID=A0M6V4_CHRFK|nr:DUF4382 domain-containing protein [Christiangramia forsetii]GGG29457.1 hypothetical protein GCM10011532_11130 [Christiangramia forsetii]CAL68349.1 conserved hypothetical protein, secreted [Christiangramia forsetii KT0803]